MKGEKRTLRQRIHDFYYTEPKPAPRELAQDWEAAQPQTSPPDAEPEQAAWERRTLRRMKITCAALLALILVAAALVIWLLRSREQEAPTDPAEPTASAAVYDPEAVILQADGYAMTAREFSYYFWSEYVYLLSSSGSAPFDTSLALSEQWYDDTTTWQDYLISQALDTAEQTAALCAAAREEGFTLPEDYQASLDEQLSAYRERAESGGFADTDSFLASLYGEGATEETFTRYLQDSFLASAYSDALYARPEFSAQEISDYYDAYADEYAQQLGVAKDDSRPCDLRCIFLVPASDDADGWAAAKAQAEDLYAQWQENPTEEYFAELAEQYNQDTLAESGGLYASVTQGQAEDVIDQWCFDAQRQSGDTTLLEIESGYVLIYYAAQGDAPSWMLSAEADLRYEAYQSAITALVDNFGFTAYLERMVLVTPESLAG